LNLKLKKLNINLKQPNLISFQLTLVEEAMALEAALFMA
jgi:hypothetical protein